MRDYRITARLSTGTFIKIISAQNSTIAHSLALDYGHKLSGYGEKAFLSSVSVTPVKKQKNKRI